MKEFIVQAYDENTIKAFEEHGAKEIVRCKDCENYIVHHFAFCTLDNRPECEDSFCDRGERRKE